MYRCQLCKKQSKEGETQFKLVKQRELEKKGFAIVEEKKVCFDCYFKKRGNF